MQLTENERDPVNMLKKYFDNKQKEKKVVNTTQLNKKKKPRVSRS